MTGKRIPSEIKQAVRIRAESESPDVFAQQLQAINSRLESMAEQTRPSESTGDRCFESDGWSDKDMQMLFYRIDGMGWGYTTHSGAMR